MKNLRFFCPPLEEKMRTCESEALRQWSILMQRGLQAYLHCRMDAAELYLSASLSIALLREACDKNGIFDQSHTLKPASILVELLLLENREEEIKMTVQQITDAIQRKPKHKIIGLERFVRATLGRIKKADSDEPACVEEIRSKKSSCVQSFRYSDTYLQAVDYRAGTN